MNQTQAPAYSECPYCGGHEFCEAAQDGSSGVTRQGHVFLGSSLVYVICLQCGGVVHSRVKNVEALLTKQEKEMRK